MTYISMFQSMYKAEKRRCTMSTFWNLYKAEKENVQALLSLKLRILKHEYVILICVIDFEKWLKLKSDQNWGP